MISDISDPTKFDDQSSKMTKVYNYNNHKILMILMYFTPERNS
jgi:hypothetical protein